MKLGIVIPLKSKQVSKDWRITCANLQSTVRSIGCQTDQDFESVVVGHDCPEFLKDSGLKTRFVAFDEFPPPVRGDDESENQMKFEVDRCSKILKGIIYLSSQCPEISHWFALDADDLIRRDFVEVLKSYGEFDSAILNNGYFYFKNTGIVNRESEFSAYCGSSAIIPDRFFSLSSEIKKDSFRKMPFGQVSHVHMEKYLIEKGGRFIVPNENIVMYVRDNGENISNAAYCNTWYRKFKKIVKAILRYQFSSAEIKRQFSILPD